MEQRSELLDGLLEELGGEHGELPESVTDQLLGALVRGKRGEAEILGQDGVLGELTRRLIERALGEELAEHLGYPAGQAPPGGAGNSRNGGTPKTVLTGNGPVRISTPRDRKGRFEPELVKKGQRRLQGLDEKIIALYAGGLSTREIETYITDLYGPGVSREMRHEGRVENRAVYVAIGIGLDGQKDVLGLWTSSHEGAKFWLGVLTEIKNRGVKEILIACVDGLKGFPPAIESVFPQAQVQLCIVHLVRASLNYVNWKERKQVAADLKEIYRAATATQAEMELSIFQAKWGAKYQAIGKLWKENWTHVVPFFEFPAEVRKVIYTTNAVESLHMSLRKIIKTRGSFPSEEAAVKLLYLALRNVIRKWDTVQGWKQALNHFEMLWGDRIQAALSR